MKHLILFLIIATALLSCKKQYKCICRVTVEATDSVTTHDYKSETVVINEAMTQKQGEAACEHSAAALRTTYRNIYGSSNFNTPQQGWKAPEAECVLQ